jgi:mevalonate kinase
MGDLGRTAHWSVPANLLLAGEYAITRPGGLGIALATSPRAHAWVEEENRHPSMSRETSPKIRVRAITGINPEVIWPDQTLPVAQSIVSEVGDLTRMGGTPSPRPGTITIDTSAFFDERTGEKLGLGSSAAAAVLLTAGVFHLHGLDPTENLTHLVQTAINAHRRAQGGRGSGYDLACSALGGTICFVGGDNPSWERVDLYGEWHRQGVQLFTWRTAIPVRSAGAVEKFDRVFPPGPEGDRFVTESNRVVEQLTRARSWAEIKDSMNRAREISRGVGAAIGVPADLPADLPAEIQTEKKRKMDWVAKTSGAGNERAVLLIAPSPSAVQPSSWQPSPVSADDRIPGRVDGLHELRELVPEMQGLRVEGLRVEGLRVEGLRAEGPCVE